MATKQYLFIGVALSFIVGAYFLYKFIDKAGYDRAIQDIKQDTITVTVNYTDTLVIEKIVPKLVIRTVKDSSNVNVAVRTYAFDSTMALGVTLSDSGGQSHIAIQNIGISGEFWAGFNEFRNIKVIPSEIRFRNKGISVLTVTKETIRPPYFSLGLGIANQSKMIGVGAEVSISSMYFGFDIGQFSPVYRAGIRVWQW